MPRVTIAIDPCTCSIRTPASSSRTADRLMWGGGSWEANLRIIKLCSIVKAELLYGPLNQATAGAIQIGRASCRERV